MQQTTHYDTLGIAYDATRTQISTAFYKKTGTILNNNPSPSNEDWENLHNLLAAYRVLSNPEERAKYDDELENSNFSQAGFGRDGDNPNATEDLGDEEEGYELGDEEIQQENPSTPNPHDHNEFLRQHNEYLQQQNKRLAGHNDFLRQQNSFSANFTTTSVFYIHPVSNRDHLILLASLLLLDYHRAVRFNDFDLLSQTADSIFLFRKLLGDHEPELLEQFDLTLASITLPLYSSLLVQEAKLSFFSKIFAVMFLVFDLITQPLNLLIETYSCTHPEKESLFTTLMQMLFTSNHNKDEDKAYESFLEKVMNMIDEHLQKDNDVSSPSFV
ncbi:MAG: DnaJ domain-containing protein [Pseudomonadota bacterium]